MAIRTPAEVLALWEDIRTNYTGFIQNTGNTVYDTLFYALLGTGGAGGGGGGGDASAAHQVTGNTTLSSILTQLQGDRTIASQLFTDATNTVYLRVLAFNTTTNLYEATTVTLAGATYTPTLPETPLLQADVDTVETTWEIVTSGAGYTVGDIVSQFSLIKQGTPPTVSAVIWYNQNTSAAIASPVLAHRRRLGVASATEATLATRLSEGAPITAETIPSGSGALGWLSSLRQRLDSIRAEAIRKATAASFGFVQTAVAGANFVPLTAGACTEVMVLNLEPNAVDIEVRRGATGATVLLPFGTSMLLEAITDSFDIQVRRADTQSPQVLVRFERRTR